jgi:hypothetical protein
MCFKPLRSPLLPPFIPTSCSSLPLSIPSFPSFPPSPLPLLLLPPFLLLHHPSSISPLLSSIHLCSLTPLSELSLLNTASKPTYSCRCRCVCDYCFLSPLYHPAPQSYTHLNPNMFPHPHIIQLLTYNYTSFF